MDDDYEISNPIRQFCKCSLTAAGCSRRPKPRARRGRSSRRTNPGRSADPGDGPVIAVQITDTRMIALRRGAAGWWWVFVDRWHTVPEWMLWDIAALGLKLSPYDRSNFLRSLLAALKRAKISLSLTKMIMEVRP